MPCRLPLCIKRHSVVLKCLRVSHCALLYRVLFAYFVVVIIFSTISYSDCDFIDILRIFLWFTHNLVYLGLLCILDVVPLCVIESIYCPL